MNEKDNKNKRVPTSQMNLVLRVAMGGMLIYIALSMRNDFDQLIFVLSAAIFALVGVALIIVSVKRLFTGDFDYLDPEGNIIEPDDLSDLDDDLEALAVDVDKLDFGLGDKKDDE